MSSAAQTASRCLERNVEPLSTYSRRGTPRRSSACRSTVRKLSETLREGEGGVGDHARGVVDRGQQVGLAPPPGVARVAAGLGAVHGVGHPQLARVLVREAAQVLGRAVGAPPRRQAAALQQAVDGRLGQARAVRHEPEIQRALDHEAHRQERLVRLDPGQLLGQRGRDAAREPAVGARLGVQGVEAALAVQAHPVPQGLDRDLAAAAAGNGPLLGGAGAQGLRQRRRPGRRMQQVRDQAVAEQRRLPPRVPRGRFCRLSWQVFLLRTAGWPFSPPCPASARRR